MSLDATVQTIMRLAEAVRADPERRGVLSTGEYIAVAMVLDKPEWLKEVRGKYTMLEAIERLGDEWTRAAIVVQKAMDRT
jgi:hypothetical protein